MTKNPTKAELERLDAELEQMLENAIPVKAHVAKDAKVVFSLRVAGRELDEFFIAAEARGMTLSDFMRAATRAAIQGDVDLKNAKAMGEVKEKARELNEAIDRLTA